MRYGIALAALLLVIFPGKPARAASTHIAFTALAATSPSHVWAAGPGVILASADGGHSWSVHQLPMNAQSVCFAGPRTGWVASADTIWKSTNGGSHWSLSFRAPLYHPNQISYRRYWQSTVHCAADGAWVAMNAGE